MFEDKKKRLVNDRYKFEQSYTPSKRIKCMYVHNHNVYES